MDLHDFRDIVGRVGSNQDEIIRSVYSYTPKKILKLSQALSKTLLLNEHKKAGRFSFVANSSLSGAAYPCGGISCRISKVQELASFGALYADHIFIQDPFEGLFLKEFSDYTRSEFILAIQTIVYLSPLIERNIISFYKSPQLCSECIEKQAGDILKNARKFDTALEKGFLKKCKACLTEVSKEFCKIEIDGPEDLINHGHTAITTTHPEIAKKFSASKFQGLPYAFSKKEMEKYNLYDLSVGGIVRDLSSIELQSRYLHSNILTDNDTQLDLIRKAYKTKTAANANNFSGAVRHTLPVIHGANLKKMVKIRLNETEAFEVYRDSFNQLINKGQNWKKHEIEEAFQDTVKPEINRINHSLKSWKSEKLSSLGTKAISTTAAVTAGLFLGVLPPGVGQLVSALGGVGGGARCLDDVLDLAKNKAVARKNNYYFLWKLGRL